MDTSANAPPERAPILTGDGAWIVNVNGSAAAIFALSVVIIILVLVLARLVSLRRLALEWGKE